MANRPTIWGTRHAIAAGHYLATAAGFSVLEAGGNAVDAGCAAGIALAVVQPDLVSIAGVAPIILRMADGTVETIAGLGTWPSAMPADHFMRVHGGRIPESAERTLVPAAPDAWITALQRHGTMRFGDVASFAIRYAREGFSVYPLIANAIANNQAAYRRWPANAAIYLPGGKPPAVGDKFVQSDLAATLQYMADQEAATNGSRLDGLAAARDAFYCGDIAARIVAHQKDNGGFLSADDLANFHSRLEPAIRRLWRGHEILVCGPWCQGPALLHALLLMERAGLDGLEHNSADYLHLLIECLKVAMADREYHYGDPAFVDVPIDALLSEDSLARRVAAIRADRAHPGMPERLDGATPQFEAATGPLPRAERDTSYVAVIDRWGNAFSATPSDGSSTAPMVPGLGIAPSTRGEHGRPDPRHPAGIAPGKRPRLTPNPAMVLTADGGIMPFGSPGGDVQPQAMLQALLNHLHFGMEIQDAIEAPRVSSFSFPVSFEPFDFHPGAVSIETRIDAATRAELARRGHKITEWPDVAWLAGSVEMVRSYPATGMIAAGADFRRPAYAMAI